MLNISDSRIGDTRGTQAQSAVHVDLTARGIASAIEEYSSVTLSILYGDELKSATAIYIVDVVR